MVNDGIGKNLETIRNLLNIETPRSESVQAINSDEDIIKHKLYGIHIKNQNDALSEIDPHICIGWSSLGDLSEVKSKDELAKIYDEHFQKDKQEREQDINQIWKFIHEIKVGDYIIFVEQSVFHIGKIISDYYFDNKEKYNQNHDYTNYRKVIWLKKNISLNIISNSMYKSLILNMTIFSINDYRAAIIDLLKGTYEKDECIEVEKKEIVYLTGLEVPYDRNRILFGAPGTGKSYSLNNDRKKLLFENEKTNYERVTFHPDYSYASFVGTYKPVPIKNNGHDSITYEYVPGPFMRVYINALRSGRTQNPKPYLLIIEEINRANVAAVFGDIFQLLDRDEKGVSEYPIMISEDMKNYLAKPEVLGGSPDDYTMIKIPDNMFIWATMNSADQGVFPMDTAFKRRWNFTYIGINDAMEDMTDIIKNKDFKLGRGENTRIVKWNDLRIAINDVLSSDVYNINEDKLLGPYFISSVVLENGNDERFIKTFKNKVLMYLFEDVVKQKKKLFFEKCKNGAKGVRYSDICKLFDEKGVFIFPDEISKRFIDKPIVATGVEVGTE